MEEREVANFAKGVEGFVISLICTSPEYLLPGNAFALSNDDCSTGKKSEVHITASSAQIWMELKKEKFES